ncbi:hypothetical protein CCHR01_02010 [Colletotrichum chrysophilum]|uniref:Uncharacterized protein n=1 Tax=Colletotrichum chrysophilum TaxID=1836956 RepID=A0AAD9EKR5_9PEZI|nr:hypothetical protein CCHR01_02010 [Colletotrichum chrysophilum]
MPLEHESDMPSLNLAFLGEIPPSDCDLFSLFSIRHSKASFASNSFATTDEQSPPTVHSHSDSGNSPEALDVASCLALNDAGDPHSQEENEAINNDGLQFEALDEVSNVLWNTFAEFTWPEEVYDQRYVTESAVSERTVWLPVALAGLLSNSSHSGPGIALFHAVCALAAYNLAELGSGPRDEDLTLAMKHDYLAITHLQHSLDGSTTGDEFEVSLAMMACVSMEAVSAVPRRWRNHMKKGLKHFQRLLTRQSVSEELLQMAWAMTSMAVLSNVMVSDEITTDAENDEAFHVAQVSGGISPRAIRNLAEINQIHKLRNRYGEKEVDSFELKLYLDFPASKSAYTETTEALILQHMDRAFYYAELVHFQRTVKGASLDSVEALIDNGLKELEAIKKVSHGSAGNISWQQVIQEESYDVLRL